MSQASFTIDDGSGAEVLAELSAAIGALATLSSGTSEPSDTEPGMIWIDTSNSLIKQRNLANSAWKIVGTADENNLGILTMLIENLKFRALNNASAQAEVARIEQQIPTDTAGSETGGIRFKTAIAGAMTKLFDAIGSAFTVFGSNGLIAQYEDDGALEGPFIDADRASATPTTDDAIGGFRTTGRNSSGAKKAFLTLYAKIKTATAGSEAVNGGIRGMVGGADTDMLLFDELGRTNPKRGVYGDVKTLTSAASVTPDCKDGNFYTLTLAHNAAFQTLANIKAGHAGLIWLIQASSGGPYTPTFASTWKFPGGVAPTNTQTASAVDLIAFVVRDATHIDAVMFSLDSK
jgi:hypothetical protein